MKNSVENIPFPSVDVMLRNLEERINETPKIPLIENIFSKLSTLDTESIKRSLDTNFQELLASKGIDFESSLKAIN